MEDYSEDLEFDSDLDSTSEFDFSEEEESENSDSEIEFSEFSDISKIDLGVIESSAHIIKKIEKAKKHYIIDRLGEFSFVGMLAQRYNQIEKGSIPLCLTDKTYYEKNNTFVAVLDEIKAGVFPILLKKNNYILKITDFPHTAVEYRLKNVCDLWKEQKKIPQDYSHELAWEN